MQLFDGMSSDQIQKLRECGAHMTYEPGIRIFQEGNPATGLYAIIHGEVEIRKKTPDGEVLLSKLSDGAIFGELGLIHHEGIRTASAYVTERSHIFAIPGNPLRLFEHLQAWGAVLVLLKNMIRVIGERMAEKEKQGGVAPAWVGAVTMDPEYQRAIKKIESLLPQDPANPFLNDRTFQPGQYLFQQGEKPDGFYFIHSGAVQIIQKQAGGTMREMTRRRAPTLVGEFGFFANQPRSASIRALDRVRTTHFSGKQFVTLECYDERRAADVAFTAVKIAALLFLKRENAEFNLG